jgi:quinolinate synthase
MKRPIIDKICTLKKQRNAVILVHNYQIPEVQDIADFVGDSLELARISSGTDCEVILFCGVHFMAETAKILNPEKTVLMPDLHAGCPMADMITATQLAQEKTKHADATVVTYINSTADVKALSDICCTSANGIEVVASVENEEIIFTPDKYLGSYIAKHTKGKRFHIWSGYCPTHMVFSKEGIQKLKAQYPDAKVLVHPECRLDVQDSADAVCSTSQMNAYAKSSSSKNFIICTEVGMLHRLKKENPGKNFIPGSPNAVCPNMKLTNLEKIVWALEDMQHEITIEETVRVKALAAIEKMVKI